jgi:hypothetical protein
MAIGFKNGQVQYYGTSRPSRPYRSPGQQPVVTNLGGGAQQLDYTRRPPMPGYAAPAAGGGGAGGGVNYSRLLGGGGQPQGSLPPVMANPMSYWNQKFGNNGSAALGGGGGQGAYKGGLRATTDNPLDVNFAKAINQKNGYGASNPWVSAQNPWGGGGGGSAALGGGGMGQPANRLGYGSQPQAPIQQAQPAGSQLTGSSIGDQLQKYTDQANQANEGRYQQLLGMAGQLSDAGMQREQRREQAGMGRVAQQSISAGLGNTTILPTLQRGVQDDSALRQESVADQGLKTQMGIVERRTDLPPDYALLASLAARPGATGSFPQNLPTGPVGSFGGGAIAGAPRRGTRGQDALQNALAPSRGGAGGGGDQGPVPPAWQQAANDAANIANGDSDAAGQWAQAGGDPWDQMAQDGGEMAAAGQDAASGYLNPPQIPFTGATPQQGFGYGSRPPGTVASPVDYLALLQKMFGGVGNAMGML